MVWDEGSDEGVGEGRRREEINLSMSRDFSLEIEMRERGCVSGGVRRGGEGERDGNEERALRSEVKRSSALISSSTCVCEEEFFLREFLVVKKRKRRNRNAYSVETSINHLHVRQR